MAVGDVAGHVFLVVRRVGKHLDRPSPPAGPAAMAEFSYPRIDDPRDLDLDLHRQVRDDGHHVAGWGWSDVTRALDTRVDTVVVGLADAPGAVTIGGRSVAFSHYLATRVVELLVHADDIATSVTLDPGPMPAVAAEVALETVLDAARQTHGDLAVLRAFTRRERAPEGGPSIY